MKKAIAVAALTTLAAIVGVSISFADPQTSGTSKKSAPAPATQKAAVPKSPQPEQYHTVDPAKIGFKIVLKVSEMSVRAPSLRLST